MHVMLWVNSKVLYHQDYEVESCSVTQVIHLSAESGGFWLKWLYWRRYYT